MMKLPDSFELGGQAGYEQVTEIVGITRAPTVDADNKKVKVKKEWQFFGGYIDCTFATKEEWP